MDQYVPTLIVEHSNEYEQISVYKGKVWRDFGVLQPFQRGMAVFE